MRHFPDKIVVATRNRSKVRELQELAKELPIRFLTLADFEGAPDVIEDGLTFEENALKKAREIFKFTKLPSLADDSGLCVNALDGRPGVLSARYAGENAPDETRYLKILEELKNVPEEARNAKFVCVLALVFESGEELLIRGECEGKISTTPVGSNGFGYDPVFFYEPLGMTFGQMDKDSKNEVSHRGRAMKTLIDKLKLIQSGDY